MSHQDSVFVVIRVHALRWHSDIPYVLHPFEGGEKPRKTLRGLVGGLPFLKDENNCELKSVTTAGICVANLDLWCFASTARVASAFRGLWQTKPEQR